MKLSNKLIIASACLCVISFALFMSSFLKNSPESISGDNDKSGKSDYSAKTVETENNVSKPVTKKSPSVSYVIKLNDGKICAYMLTDGAKPLLWNSTDIPLALSAQDKAALEQGIYTNSFEELCLYFESYAS